MDNFRTSTGSNRNAAAQWPRGGLSDSLNFGEGRARACREPKNDAISYASNRFGGSEGQVHVYDESGKTSLRKYQNTGQGWSRKPSRKPKF